MFMSRREKKLLEAMRKQLNTLSWAVAHPYSDMDLIVSGDLCDDKAQFALSVRRSGEVFNDTSKKSIKGRIGVMHDVSAHERINALCDELGCVVDVEPERYVVRKKQESD